MATGARAILFGALLDAVAWARLHGGWIVSPEDPALLVWWFPVGAGGPTWTQSRVLAETAHLGTRTVGTWPMFADDALTVGV